MNVTAPYGLKHGKKVQKIKTTLKRRQERGGEEKKTDNPFSSYIVSFGDSFWVICAQNVNGKNFIL